MTTKNLGDRPVTALELARVLAALREELVREQSLMQAERGFEQAIPVGYVRAAVDKVRANFIAGKYGP